ncbi:MAG: ABC transporter permease subunit [Steroidobacteraceae bacterium]
MNAILTVFFKEFRENLRDRRTLFSALILGPLFGPLVLAGVLQLSFKRNDTQADRPVLLAVSHAERAPNLVQYLAAHGVTALRQNYDDDAARAAVTSGRQRAVLLIPEDFAARFRAAEPAPLLLYADAADAFNDREINRARQVLTEWNMTVSRLRLLARGTDPLLLSAVAVQDIDVSTPATRSVLALGALSYLVIIAMLMGGLYLAIDATAGERERGSLEPLLTTPVPREQLIYGKILAACAYMVISLAVTVTAFALVLRFTALERFGMSAHFGPLGVLALIACSAPLALLGASLLTIVAAYTRSYREAQTWLGFVLLVPTLPLAYASVTGVKPTLALMAVPSLSQHFLIMSRLREEPLPWSFIAVSVGCTLLLGALLTLAAGRLYRREALLG